MFSCRLLNTVRQFQSVVVIVAIGTLAHYAHAQSPPAKDKTGDNHARVLLEGDWANSRAFRAFRCEYTITKGTAASRAKAIDGTMEKEEVTEVEWLVNEDKECWSFRADDTAAEKVLKAEAAKGAQGVVAGSFAISQFFLSNGREQIGLASAIGLANVHTSDNPRSQRDFLPWGASAMGPGDKHNIGRDLLNGLDEGTARYRGTEDFYGAELHQIEWTDGSRSSTYSVDPRRGYLPIRCVTINPGAVQVTIEMIITDAKECSRGRWFPWRALELLQQSNLPHIPLVREFRIKKLDADNAPPDADFRISLPRGTRVVFPHDVTAVFVAEATTNVGLSDIPKLIERGAAESARRRRENSGTSTWWWWLGGGLLALVCITGLWRRYRSRPPSQGIQ